MVVIGIDLGTSDSYVAYVARHNVDIVQNEVSKRNTSSLVGYTGRERLLGDAALAQIRSNAKNSCRGFKHLLGQKVDSPLVQQEAFWSTCPLEKAADGFAGFSVSYKGEERVMSSAQVTAAFLTKLRDTTEKWCQTKVSDAVIGVPSYFSDVHRHALLDACKIANISVLRLMNEYTATALAYGIYRSNEFDAEKPCTVAFCSVGHSVFSVSIVQFVKGKLSVVCEASEKAGGRDVDECLIRTFADQFQKKTGLNPMSNKKSFYKLEDAVTKTKKVLSANSEGPVNVECLMEDEDFASNITREAMEKMCGPAMEKVQSVLNRVKAMSTVPVDQVDFVEIVGGASRIPWVKEMCSAAFGGKQLSTTMNADESVARGCVLQAAILSPLYKVRDFKVEDCSPFSVTIGWVGSSADAEPCKDRQDDEDTNMAGGEGELKSLLLFPAGSPTNVLKAMTFYRKGPFEVKAQYGDDSPLIPGTSKELGVFRIELPPSTDVKKVKVKAKLSIHGTFSIQGAQMIEEEEYEETVKEKRELPAESAAETKIDKQLGENAEAGEANDGDKAAATEPPKEERKFEWIDVVKKKKRSKRTDLAVTASGAPGLSSKELQALADEEKQIQAEMREITETDEMRNDLESYIFNMRDKIAESGEYGRFISASDREQLLTELQKAEDWLYDTCDGTKTHYGDKLGLLKALGDPVAWRSNEHSMRDDWINAVGGTIANYRQAAENGGEKYGHIDSEKLATIAQKCNEVQKWLDDLKAKQAGLSLAEKPVLLCADMERQNQELAKFADDILKEPKPAPPPPPKGESDEKKEAAADDQPADPAS
jgi:heat shock protein 4